MKTLLLATVSIVSLVGTLPAAAVAQDQPPPGYGGAPPPPADQDHMDRDHMDRDHMDHDRMERPGGEWPLDRRVDWLARRIDRASEAGWLSGNEIGRGHAELDAIRRDEARLRDRDGGQLSPEDRSYLYQRVDELNRTLRWSGHNPPAPWTMG